MTAGVAGQLPNNTFVGIGVIIGGQVYEVTAFNAATNTITLDRNVTVGAGAAVSFIAENIAGVGRSTFRTSDATIPRPAATLFTNVISDFNDAVLLNPGVPDAAPLFGNPQTFTWDVDANSPIYVFP